MRYFLVLMVFSLCFVNAGLAQDEKLETGDSIRLEMERAKVSNELIQLRDSIKYTLTTFSKQSKKRTNAEERKYNATRLELLKYQNQLKLDLEEIKLTAQKGWTKDSSERILANTAVARKNYKRICAMF